MQQAVRRVFISHTTELRTYPRDRSFVAAAEEAVRRAGDVVIDMAYFSAHVDKQSDYVVRHVRDCDVFVCIVGFRYGGQVADRPDLSYTELEFQVAAGSGTPILTFLLSEDTPLPRELIVDSNDARQMDFRRRLRDIGQAVTYFRSTAELESKLYQALTNLKVWRPSIRTRPSRRTPKKIFISHATADRALSDCLVDFLLFAGIPEEAIFYSSQRTTGTPTGVNFSDDIRAQLEGASLVIQLLTQTYLCQQYCMSELSAPWLLGVQPFPIAVSPITPSHVAGTLIGVQVSDFNEETFDELHGVLDALGFDLPIRRWKRAYQRVFDNVDAIIAGLPPAPLVARDMYDKVRSELEDARAEIRALRSQATDQPDIA